MAMRRCGRDLSLDQLLLPAFLHGLSQGERRAGQEHGGDERVERSWWEQMKEGDADGDGDDHVDGKGGWPRRATRLPGGPGST